MFFCADKREDVKKAHPDAKITEISKQLGAQWKSLTDGDKKKYEAEAAKDKSRYEVDKKAYEASGAKGSAKSKKKGKSSDDESSSEDDDE